MMTAQPEHAAFRFLTPTQSASLRNWAELAHAQADATRPPAIRETAVQLILQGVDDLVGHLGEPEDDVVDEQRIRLFKNLAWLTGRPAPAGQRALVIRFRQARAAGDVAAAFDYLLQALTLAITPLERREP